MFGSRGKFIRGTALVVALALSLGVAQARLDPGPSTGARAAAAPIMWQQIAEGPAQVRQAFHVGAQWLDPGPQFRPVLVTPPGTQPWSSGSVTLAAPPHHPICGPVARAEARLVVAYFSAWNPLMCLYVRA